LRISPAKSSSVRGRTTSDAAARGAAAVGHRPATRPRSPATRRAARPRLSVRAAPVHRPAPRRCRAVYQFHALFREFLVEEGRRRLTPPSGATRSTGPAGSSYRAASSTRAAALYREAQAWPALTGLALHAGAALIADGRTNTLAQWIDALPADAHQREPRLSLYLGVALLYSDPKRAKRLLTARTRDSLRAAIARVLMTAAHAVDCHYFEWAIHAARSLDRPYSRNT
jgi:hypothetical protein